MKQLFTEFDKRNLLIRVQNDLVQVILAAYINLLALYTVRWSKSSHRANFTKVLNPLRIFHRDCMSFSVLFFFSIAHDAFHLARLPAIFIFFIPYFIIYAINKLKCAMLLVKLELLCRSYIIFMEKRRKFRQQHFFKKCGKLISPPNNDRGAPLPGSANMIFCNSFHICVDILVYATLRSTELIKQI